MSMDFVNLRLFWKGPYFYQKGGDWNIKVLDVSIAGRPEAISTILNTEKPSSEEQQLHFAINDGGSYLDPHSIKVCETISCPLTSAKTITITARIFQAYENRSRATMNSYGRLGYERRARRGDLPVKIDPLPKFISGKSYDIRIIHENGTLRATCTRNESGDLQAFERLLEQGNFDQALNEIADHPKDTQPSLYLKVGREFLKVNDFAGADEVFDRMSNGPDQSRFCEERFAAHKKWTS